MVRRVRIDGSYLLNCFHFGARHVEFGGSRMHPALLEL